MNRTKIVAVVLMAAGIIGLAYGGFSYTEDTHEANIGSMHMSIDETRHVNVPVWAGVGMLLVGGRILQIETASGYSNLERSRERTMNKDQVKGRIKVLIS